MTAFVDRRDPAMAKWLASTKVESGNINNGGIAFKPVLITRSLQVLAIY